MSYDESDDSNEEESDKLGSRSRSADTVGTRLGGLLRGLVFLLVVTLSYDESHNDCIGSLSLPYKNIGEAGTRECTNYVNMFYCTNIS